MPGWHADTRDLQASGALQMVGIIQEQHPERCRLFMQWKQMDWPVLVDPLNLSGIKVVPITYAIDEWGVVRYINPTREQFDAFMASHYPRPADPAPHPPVLPDLRTLESRARQSRSGNAGSALGEALFLWGGETRLDDAIDALERAVRLLPDDGPAHFGLGTALRARSESVHRQADDFRRAVEHWTRALDIDPNQYIWRRRLQQYGPRLDKPYPFYDWIEEARRDIRARGETPLPLQVEPAGSEIASPAKAFEPAVATGAEPDARGRIIRDPGRFIVVETAVVPPRLERGDTARVHLTFRPNERVKAHWNNETDPLRVWVAAPDGWAIDRSALTVPNPREPLSTETRELQFEVRSPTDARGTMTIPLYALYYVCEDVDGTCLYRRQDVQVNIEIRR